MRHNHILAATLLGGLMILSAACVKEAAINEQYRPAGSEIVFSAATGYSNGIGTRTEYSGYINASNDYERINWIQDDPMTITYMHGEASQNGKYLVTSSITPNQEKSMAEIEAESTKLYWGEGAGDHYFYAMYPSTGFKNNGTASLVGKHVKGSIPSTQTVTLKNGVYSPAMEYGYMVAYQKVAATSSTTTVTLPFRPAMTAFQFRFSTQDDTPREVRSFEMSSVGKMAGTFEFDITGGNDRGATWTSVSTSGTANAITVNFAGTAPKIEKNKVLDFTVFALPVDMSQVTIKLNFADGTSKRLELKKNADTWFSFQATKKYLITNTEVPGAEVWDYFIEEIPDQTFYGHLADGPKPFNVVSYKVKRGTTTKVPVAWNIEYQPKGSSSWSSSNDGKIGVTVTSGDGSAVTVANGASVLRDHLDSEKDGSELEDAAIAALRTAPEIPADALSGGEYDLSKHPVYGSGQFDFPTEQETANCYVVQRPGLYKFPLVYGNAIKHATTNKASYDVSDKHESGDESYFLAQFRRHDNQPITAPWIKDNGITVTDAVIAWQDGTKNADNVIIKDASVYVEDDYVHFEVERGQIRPGNIVIAAKAGSTIVWSWHIWVTEKDLTPHRVKDANGDENLMMNYNLGWMDATSAWSLKWNDWTMNVRVTQAESGKQVTFKVRQVGESQSVDPNVGSNTFYQWGRKDPMLPAAFTDKDKDQYSSTGLLWENSYTHRLSGGTLDFSKSIQHPNWQYVSLGYNEGYYDGNTYYLGNLWDSGLKSAGNVGDFGKRPAVKTVYDPCPPGFVVPNEFAFTYFGNGTDYTSPLGSGTLRGTLIATKGYNFQDGFGGKIFFPFCGARAHDGAHGSPNVSIYDVEALGYYWTACPNRYNSTTDYSGVQGRKTAKMMIMTDTYIRAAHEQRKGAAYAIRPVLEVSPW